jgi:hypothetical protein
VLRESRREEWSEGERERWMRVMRRERLRQTFFNEPSLFDFKRETEKEKEKESVAITIERERKGEDSVAHVRVKLRSDAACCPELERRHVDVTEISQA